MKLFFGIVGLLVLIISIVMILIFRAINKPIKALLFLCGLSLILLIIGGMMPEKSIVEGIKTEKITTATNPHNENKFKSESSKVVYDELARFPDRNVDKKIIMAGKIIQVIEDVEYRLAVNGDYNQVVLVKYSGSFDKGKILVNDYVTFWGAYLGTITYDAIAGSTTVPGLEAEYYAVTNISNTVMTTGLDSSDMAIDQVTEFPVYSNVYVSAELHDAPDHTKITFTWYFEGERLDSATINNGDVSDAPIWGSMPAGMVNRRGNYLVEIYLGDQTTPKSITKFLVK